MSASCVNDFSNIFSFNHSFDRRNTRTFVCVCVSFWVEEGGLELLPATLLVTRKFHLDVNWLLWISVQSPIVSLQPSWHLKLEEGL